MSPPDKRREFLFAFGLFSVLCLLAVVLLVGAIAFGVFR